MTQNEAKKALDANGDNVIVSGKIVAILLEKPSGFCILKIRPESGEKAFSVVGPAGSPKIGDAVEVHGHWEINEKFGRQLRADIVMKKGPQTIEAIRAYLTSGQIPGIGAIIADRIIAEFGEKTIEILDKNPSAILSVQGVGAGKAEKISAAWAEQSAVRNILLLLGPHGVTGQKAVRIYKSLGGKAIGLIQNNPYILCERVHGITFPTADAIALKNGLSPEAPRRIAAAVTFSLKNSELDGHCAMPREKLMSATAKLLSVAGAVIQPIVAEMIDGEALIADVLKDQELIYSEANWRAERAIAENLTAMAAKPPRWASLNIDSHIGAIEARTKKTLSDSQRQALKTVMHSRLAIITGGPGTGKTTLLDTLLKLHALIGTKIKLAAPTGRAARRIQEQTGIDASTLHRLFRIGAKENDEDDERANQPMQPFDLLIVDESSMIDLHLMHTMLSRMPPNAGLLMVGDIDQLPSVGPGRILGDLIDSGLVPVARLQETFRQSAGSLILANARRINKAEPPIYPVKGVKGDASDFYFVEVETPEKGAEMIVRIVNDRIPEIFGYDRVKDIQVLSPMRKGDLGCINLNLKLREKLNKNTNNSIDRFGNKFSVGDKVMQLVNDYEKNVFNGDVGIVLSINEEDKSIVVEIDDDEINYAFSDLDTLVHAYATTIHKAQGSEYPAVVIAFSSSHRNMLAKNLLYTAITRGKKFVVIVGDKRAISIALLHFNVAPRCTGLKQRMTPLIAADGATAERERVTLLQFA